MSSRTRAIVVTRAGGMLALAILLASAPIVAAAEDVVYLKPQGAGRGAPGRLAGRILDYTGQELRLEIATGRQRAVPADQIDRIETTHSAEQLNGDRAFARGDFRLALDQYRLALAATREPRDWMRRQILAQVVWCQRNLDRPDQAGEYFLILYSRDPATRDFACIPLTWIDEQPPSAMVQKADAWLADWEHPAAVLMGASVLLSTPRRKVAMERLHQLAAGAEPRLAWLAQAQLWRVAAPDATREQLGKLSDAIEASDVSLRAGPYFVVGSALARHDPQAAALVLLKLPILYEREYRLAAAALLAAGGCLEKVKQAAQAAGLYRELARKYTRGPEADEARRRLQRLASIDSARDN